MTTGAKFAWGFVVLIAILHFDFWLWDSTSVVFGFLPTGLAYQAGISLAASVAWVLVIRFDWPDGVEEWAAQDEVAASEEGA